MTNPRASTARTSRALFDHPEQRPAARPSTLAGASPATPLPRTTPLRWLVAVIAGIAIVDQSAVALRFARHVVIEDQTILWYAAREWGQGHFREPHYTGQTYGSTLEAIPTEALRWLGVPPSAALPVVLVSLALGSWFLVSWISLRRGRPVLALAAAAAPILLTTYHAQYVSFYGAGAGRFLAVLSLGVVIGWPDRRSTLMFACAAGSIAFVVDASALLLVGPVLVYAFIRAPALDRIGLGVVGFAPAMVWLLYDRWFYATHPDYGLHPAASSLDVSILRSTYEHPARYFEMFAPELFRSWTVPVALAAFLVVLLLATRRARFALPALIFLAVVVVALSSTKALDGPSPLLPYARIFLLLPLTLWFLAFLAAESGLLGRWRAVLPAVVASVVLLVVVTAAVRATTLPDRNRALLRDAAHAGYIFPVVPTDVLQARCRRMSEIARQTQTHLVVLLVDRAAAYGCGAASYGSVRTLFPAYERRTWLLHDEATRRRSRLLVFGVQGNWCDEVSGLVTGCKLISLATPAEGLAAAVQFGTQSALTFLRRAGAAVRAFGDDCDPDRPTRCR